MRDKRADSRHFRLEFVQKAQIFGQIVRGLPRSAHHHARSGLKSCGLEFMQTAPARCKGLRGGMQPGVMGRVGALVPQQIAIRACFPKTAVTFRASFSDGQRDRAVRIAPLDGSHQFDDTVVCKVRVFSALKNKGTETEFVASRAAGQNFLRRQAVAGGMGVGAPDAAIQAVIAAEVGELDEAAHIDTSAEGGTRRLPRGGEKPGAQSFAFRAGFGTGVYDADKRGVLRHIVAPQRINDAGKKCGIGGQGHTADRRRHAA